MNAILDFPCFPSTYGDWTFAWNYSLGYSGEIPVPAEWGTGNVLTIPKWTLSKFTTTGFSYLFSVTATPPDGYGFDSIDASTTVKIIGSRPVAGFAPTGFTAPLVPDVYTYRAYGQNPSSKDLDNPPASPQLNFTWYAEVFGGDEIPPLTGQGTPTAQYQWTSLETFLIRLTVCASDEPGPTYTGCTTTNDFIFSTTAGLLMAKNKVASTDVVITTTCNTYTPAMGSVLRCQDVSAPALKSDDDTMTLYSWSSQNVNLASVATTPLNTQYLSVDTSKLAFNTTYTLLYTVTVVDAITSIVLETNSQQVVFTTSPNVPKTISETPLTITPAQGYAFTTKFTLQAWGWMSMDGLTAMSYIFFFEQADGTESLITDRDFAAYADVYLPAGVNKVGVYIYHADGSSTRFTYPVSVQLDPLVAKEAPECIATAVIRRELTYSKAAYDMHTSIQLDSYLATFVNAKPVTGPAPLCQEPLYGSDTVANQNPVPRDDLNGFFITDHYNTAIQIISAEGGISEVSMDMGVFLAQRLADILRAVPLGQLNSSSLDLVEQELNEMSLALANEGLYTPLAESLIECSNLLVRHASVLVECDRVQRTLANIQTMLVEVADERLPGEAPFVYIPQDKNIETLVQKVLTTNAVTISGSASSVQISAEALAQAAAAGASANVDVHLLMIKALGVGPCRGQTLANQGPALVSEVVDVVLYNQDLPVPISGLSEGNGVTITVASTPETCTVAEANLGVTCLWWSSANFEWSSEGCTTVASHGQTTCSCNHLTEFAAFQQNLVCVDTQTVWAVMIVCATVLTYLVFAMVIFVYSSVVKESDHGDQLGSSLFVLSLLALSSVSALIVTLHYLENLGSGLSTDGIIAFQAFSVILTLIAAVASYLSLRHLATKPQHASLSFASRTVLVYTIVSSIIQFTVMNLVDDVRVIMGVMCILNVVSIATLVGVKTIAFRQVKAEASQALLSDDGSRTTTADFHIAEQ